MCTSPCTAPPPPDDAQFRQVTRYLGSTAARPGLSCVRHTGTSTTSEFLNCLPSICSFPSLVGVHSPNPKVRGVATGNQLQGRKTWSCLPAQGTGRVGTKPPTQVGALSVWIHVLADRLVDFSRSAFFIHITSSDARYFPVTFVSQRQTGGWANSLEHRR